MQFCTDCGGVLNLFGNNTSELCSSCIQQKKRIEPTSPQPTQKTNKPLAKPEIADAILTVKDGKIVLRSKEGWQLWAAPVESENTLESMLKSADLIYKIRSKRKKKS